MSLFGWLVLPPAVVAVVAGVLFSKHVSSNPFAVGGVGVGSFVVALVVWYFIAIVIPSELRD